MIPKKIHYIWLGGKPLPPIFNKCLKSWKKYCPDYEIIRWDESNLNLDFCDYCRQAYDQKKFAFASDVLRFDVLYKEGGVYVDIDVEFLKPLDELLTLDSFTGFETSNMVAPGLIMGTQPGNKVVKDMLDIYSKMTFEYNPQNQITICKLLSNNLIEKGLVCNNSTQVVDGMKIFSSEYFCPVSLSDGKIRKTENTITIHHYQGSWVRKSDKVKQRILMLIKRVMGQKIVDKLKKRKNIVSNVPQQKTRVLHLLASNRYSGAENVACQIIKMLEDSCEFAYCSPDGVIKDNLIEKDVKFYPLKKLNHKNLKKVVKDFKPDIIHAHDVRAIVEASRFSKKTKVVAHIHCNHQDFHKKSIRSMLFKYLVKKNKIASTIFVSNGSYDDYIYKNILKNKYSILHNVIDVDDFVSKVEKSNYNDKSDVVYLGRLTQIKNPLRIVEIIKLVKEKYPNIKVSVVGDGELREDCELKVKEYNLSENIRFYGHLTNGYGLLKNSKIMIMTSKSEGTPMCALEAQALGLPIVSTKTDGMVELLEGNGTGCLFDTDAQACGEILSLLENSEKYKTMVKKVEAFSKNYNDVDVYKNAILNIYKVCD